MSDTYAEEQVVIIKALIVQYQAMALSLATNPRKSYTINTGQTIETVSYERPSDVIEILDALQSQLAYWVDQCSNGGALYVRAAY